MNSGVSKLLRKQSSIISTKMKVDFKIIYKDLKKEYKKLNWKQRSFISYIVRRKLGVPVERKH